MNSRVRALYKIDAQPEGPAQARQIIAEELSRLRLPARGKAIYKLPGGDLEYIEVTLTGLHYDTGAAPQEGKTR